MNGVELFTGDCLEWGRTIPDDSIDLLFTSPPYLEARTYGIGAGRKLDAWVSWMMEVVAVFAPKVKGIIAINCEGQTRDFQYLPAPFLLMADLHRAGYNLRKPVVFHRVGIPGSGGPDWLRNDWEPIICITREGKLPWSDNTACGHAPKWAPGGEMSHRLSDGTRRNQWGGSAKSGGHRKKDGSIANGTRASHRFHTKREADGTMREQSYGAPVLANPGNVIEKTYTATEVAEILAWYGEDADVIPCNVGGGRMGSGLAHENEAPMPLELAEFLVKSFCPPDGVVCDPFVGSGTLPHAALLHGRKFVGGDIRQNQIDLTRRRIFGVTPATLFHEPQEA